VATDMPGVRTIVQRTGTVQIVHCPDPHALGLALARVLYENTFTPKPPSEIFRLLDLSDTTQMYEDLFRKVANGEPV
jgi:hypothetical protein